MPRTSIEPVDVYVGTRVRARRQQLGMSQSTLADGLGVTFQQVQKYEKGSALPGWRRSPNCCRCRSPTSMRVRPAERARPARCPRMQRSPSFYRARGSYWSRPATSCPHRCWQPSSALPRIWRRRWGGRNDDLRTMQCHQTITAMTVATARARPRASGRQYAHQAWKPIQTDRFPFCLLPPRGPYAWRCSL